MDDPGKINRRPVGSIDTDHYRDIAHRLRSAAVRRWLVGLVEILRRRRADAPTGPAA